MNETTTTNQQYDNGKDKDDNCIITVHSGEIRGISSVSQLLKQTQDAVF
jgi:hypothetical protein